MNEADALSALAVRAKASWGYPKEWIEAWTPDLQFRPDLFARATVMVATVMVTAGRVGRDGDGERRPGVELGVDSPLGVVVVSGPDPNGEGERDEAEIEHLWVDPACQGAGIGRALLEAALEIARRSGAESVRVESDPNARSFYERMGGRYMQEVPAPVLGIDRTLPVLRFEL